MKYLIFLISIGLLACQPTPPNPKVENPNPINAASTTTAQFDAKNESQQETTTDKMMTSLGNLSIEEIVERYGEENCKEGTIKLIDDKDNPPPADLADVEIQWLSFCEKPNDEYFCLRFNVTNTGTVKGDYKVNYTSFYHHPMKIIDSGIQKEQIQNCVGILEIIDRNKLKNKLAGYKYPELSGGQITSALSMHKDSNMKDFRIVISSPHFDSHTTKHDKIKDKNKPFAHTSRHKVLDPRWGP